ncbi:hypothetical protein MIR68_001895 [Amoeboaphelidium protococcarum]|nr:hypothetical protein MIR68_001895 [Amoeboaphelidium protococcarum]
MGALNQAKRSLFIFYYSGHGKCINGANSLVLTAKDCLNEHNRDSYRDFYYVKEVLMEASTINQMMDVLMVLDCCCSALGGNKIASLSGKVEFVSATPKEDGGVTSSRSRFTRAWCNAIDTFIKTGREFSVQDIIDQMNLNQAASLDQNIKLFNLKYGNRYPIKFMKPAVENPLSRLREVVKSRVVVVAFHIKESTGDDVVAELNKALSALNIGISAVATAAFGFNLLLVEMPEMIVDSLKLGQSYVSLIYSGKMLIIKESQIYKGQDVMARITIQSQLYPTKAAMEQRLIEWIDNELPWLSRDEKSVISQRLSARLGWKWLEKSFEVTLDQVDNTFTLAYLD